MTRIALVGARGSGKTTVGRALAERLGWAFADADDLVEAAAGQSISGIFASHGESHFRHLEAIAVATTCQRDGIVLATGGGAVTHSGTRSILKTTCFTVWLRADVSVMAERVANDPNSIHRRPALIAALTTTDEIHTLLGVRESLYRDVSRFTIDTTVLSPNDVALAIERALPGKGRPA